MGDSKKEKELRKKLKPKKFTAGDWIIFSDEADAYFKYLSEDVGERKRTARHKAKIVLSSNEKTAGVFDIVTKTEGKSRMDSSKYYRLATEDEIKEARIRKIF